MWDSWWMTKVTHNSFLCISLYFQFCACFEHIVLIIRRGQLCRYNLSCAGRKFHFLPAHDTATDTEWRLPETHKSSSVVFAHLVHLQTVRLAQFGKFSRFWMNWILCNMTPCSPVEIYNLFRRTSCLHLQGRHLHFCNETGHVGLHTAHSMLTAHSLLWDGCNQNAVYSTWHEL